MRVLALFGAGCSAMFTTYEPRDVSSRYEPDPRPPVVSLRTDQLTTTITLEPAGDVRLAIDLDTACRSIPFEHRVDTIEERAHMSTTGIVTMVLGAGAVLGSLAGTGTVDGEYCTRYGGCQYGPHLAYTSSLAVGAVLVGTAMLVVPFLVQPHGSGARRTREDVPDAPPTAVPAFATVGVPCSDPQAAMAAIGDIVMTAPWGAQLHAHPGADGIARFPIDWGTAGDPSGHWELVASRVGLHLAWTPTPAERRRMDALR